MRTKAQHLSEIERAYKDQGKVSSTVGLYLREPFAANGTSAKLADEIYEASKKIEEKLRELYQIENEVQRP